MPVMDDVRRIFGRRDYRGFCRHMCETDSDTFSDYELFSRGGLGAHMGDQVTMKGFILDNHYDNIYKIFVRDVLESLVLRGFLKSHIQRQMVKLFFGMKKRQN
jgi:hypothetical protein